MTWNHRVIKKIGDRETSYQIHEVFYDEHGAIEGWTQKAMSPWGESTGELRSDIQFFWSAFGLPVLVENKGEDGKEVLQEVPEDRAINPGHYREVLDRSSVAMAHFDDFVASHPVIRRDEELKTMAHEASSAMFRLYQKLGSLVVPGGEEK